MRVLILKVTTCRIKIATDIGDTNRVRRSATVTVDVVYEISATTFRFVDIHTCLKRLE